MSGRDEVDVVTVATCKLKHYLGQSFVRDLILYLLFVRLRDLIVLAIDAAQIAVAEKYVARAVSAYERRLFAKMRRVGGDDGQATGITGGYLVFQAIVQAIARADATAFQHRFQGFDAPLKLASAEKL